MKYELTIFITTFERPKYLEECLINLSKQTYKKFKVIILDNSEKINYKNILTHNYNFEILYKRNEKNIGSVKNLFQAFNWEIDTDYFMIFHDDDLMHKYFLQICIDILKTNTQIAWVASNAAKENFNQNKKIRYKQKLLSKKQLVNSILSRLDFTYSSLIYNKKNLNKLNLDIYYDKYSIIHDRPLIIDLIKKNKLVCIIEEKLIYYRIHNDQDSKTSYLNISIENQLNLYKYYKDNINKQPFNLIKFYLFVANNIIGDFLRLNNKNKISFINFLMLAKKEGVINIYFPILYSFAKVYYLLKKIKNLIS